MIPTVHEIDILEFIRSDQRHQAQTPLSALPRIAAAVLNPEASLQWHAQGAQAIDSSGRKQDQLSITGQAPMAVTCSRCLEPIQTLVQINRAFWFVKDEATAQALDSEIDDVDFLVASRQFDLVALVEDELLMAMPLQPVHDLCELPRGEIAENQTPQDAPNPFAVLSALKKKM